MPIDVTCESCYNSYRVREDRAGTVMKCKECGERIRVPAGDGSSDDDDGGETIARNSSKGKRKGKSAGAGSQKVMILAGVSGLVVVLIAGLALMFMKKGNGGGEAVAAIPPVAPQAGTPAVPGNPAANPATPAAVANTPTAAGTPAVVPNPAAPPVAGATAQTNAGISDGAWDVRVDPLPAALAWPEKVSLNIPVPGRDDNILSPSSQSPFVAFGFSAYESQGAQIWNLATNKQVGLIKGKPPNASSRIISPDGRYMAIKVLEKNVFNKIEIWSFETGQLVRTMQDIKEMNLVILDFGPPDQLFVYTYGNPGGKYIHKIQVWDIPKGTLLREIVTDGEQVDQYRYAFSPGRRYFATLKSDNNLNVFDLTTAKRAGHIKLPSASQLEQNLNPEGLRFSPDGTQLVALLDGSAETRIMVIDVQTGKHDPERDSAFPGRLMSAIDGAPSYKGPKLECLHNGSYLIAGSLWIDGDTGRIVWYLDYGTDKYNFAQRIPTPHGLIVPEGPDEVRHLVVLETPWEAITASLKAIDAEAPAAVRPGQPVSLDIKIGKLQHGTKEETTAALTEALTERLAAAGIEIKEGQPTVLRVIYGEAAGETLQESTRDRNNPFGAGTPTGRSVQATKAGLVVSWVRDKETKPLWTKNILVNPSFLIIRGDITAEKARTAMFEGLKNTLVSQPMPYYIPDDKKLVQLPGSTVLKDPKLTPALRDKIRLDSAKKRKK